MAAVVFRQTRGLLRFSRLVSYSLILDPNSWLKEGQDISTAWVQPSWS